MKETQHISHLFQATLVSNDMSFEELHWTLLQKPRNEWSSLAAEKLAEAKQKWSSLCSSSQAEMNQFITYTVYSYIYRLISNQARSRTLPVTVRGWC